jgi:hypothetical protein
VTNALRLRRVTLPGPSAEPAREMVRA